MSLCALVFIACTIGAAAPTRARAQDHSSLRALLPLGEAANTEREFTQELRLGAAQDGTLIAWMDGQGARLALSVYDSAGNELVRDEPGLSARPARVETLAKRGEQFVILCEAIDVQPWAWARVGAAVAAENEATRGAPERARSALRQAQELEAADDPEAQRAVLAGAICELLSLPDAKQSRAVADGLWSMVFPAFSSGELEGGLAAATTASETQARFEALTTKQYQLPRIGESILLSELGRFAQAAMVGAEVEANYARSISADDLELAKVRINLANYLLRTGEVQRPARLVADALAVYECRLPPENPERQRCESSAAQIDLAMGKSDEAALRFRDLYRRALASKDEASIQDAGGNYAIALFQSGELERAREIEEESLARCERLLPADHPILAQWRENLAATLMDLGDWPRARELLLQALARFEQGPSMDRHMENVVLCNLGEVERRRGSYPEARGYFERALEIGSKSEDRTAAISPLNGLAQTMLAQGESELGKSTLERLLSLRIALQGEDNLYTQSARSALADCLRNRGEWKRSLELGERALSSMAAQLPADDPRIFELRLMILMTHAGAGEHERATGELSEWMSDAARTLARASLDGAVRVVEERAYSWRTQSGAALAQALELHADAKLADECLSLLETGRASSLWAADALRLAGDSEALSTSRRELAQLSRELARASGEEHSDAASIERLTATKDRAESKLIDALIQAGTVLPWGEPVDPERLRAALRPDEAALSYAQLDGKTSQAEASPRLIAMILRREGHARLVDLGPGARVDEALLAWRKALGTEGNSPASAADERRAGEALRTLVFDPLRGLLDGVQRIFLVPDGALHLVALDALPDGSGVLGDHVSLRIVPALTVLAPSLERRAPSHTVVLIGGLDYGPGDLPQLIGSGEEVARVAELYRSSNREVHVLGGRSVGRERFASELAGAGILHIATHGELAPPAPIQERAETSRAATKPWTPSLSARELSPLALCGLALSGANERSADGERSGFVRGVELASLDASRCEIVVLSACDTRAGVARPGLAVASLEKAMHMAGARAVLASLWQVDDAQSRELMVEFHRGLVEHALSPADALWQAKSALRSKRLPVRAWAGWVLSSIDVRSGP